MVEPTPERGTADRRRTAFVSMTVAFAVFLYLFSPFSSLLLGWFVDFDDNISHRVHEITFGMLLAMVLVGVIVQLRRPENGIAGMQQAVAVVLILTIVVTRSTGWEWTTLLYLVPVLAIALLHPARHEVFRPRVRPAGGLLFLMAMLTFPALFAFSEEFAKASNNVRFHQAHWGGMAAFGLAILATGYIAAFRVRGWPVAAWTTGIAMLVYGMASLSFRFDASARPDIGAVLLLMWGVIWLVAAERARLGAARRPVAAELGTSSGPDGPVVLRRARSGRLIGGVAIGVARYLGVTVLFVRLLFALSTILLLLGPLAYALAWLLIPLEAPDEVVAVPAGAVSAPMATGRKRYVWTVPAVVVALLTGVCATSLSKSESPPVPHIVESAAPSSCLECHATGDEFAPVIEPLTHNLDGDPPRLSPPHCASCHDLPPIGTALEEVGYSTQPPGHYALSDQFRQDHREMFVLGDDDMARLLSLGERDGVQP